MTEQGPTESDPRHIQSVLNSFEIIGIVRERQGARIRDIAENVDLSKPSIHTHLTTLCETGFLEKEGAEYKLGMEFIPAGEYVKNRLDIYHHSRPVVDDVLEESYEAVHLVVENDGLEMTVYETWGEDAVATNYHTRIRESPQHLHYSSTGKALLAHFSTEKIDEIIEKHGLTEQTPRTITDRDALFDRLELIRERGYAVNDEEELHGIRAVGAPIKTPGGDVLGALSVSGPKQKLAGEVLETTLPERVTHASNLIEINLDLETKASD